MRLRILTENDVRSLIDMDAAIPIQEEAFARLASGESVEGLRSFVVSETPPGVAIFNPSFLKNGEGYGVKVVSDFFGNTERGVARMSAIVTLFDGETGHPRTVMEGGYLTDLRTGAGTGAAARRLARADSRVVAVVGAGRVARNQLQALARTHDLGRVLIAGRSESRARAFADWIGAQPDMPDDVALAGSTSEALGEADIVVAATTSSEPVVLGRDLRPGTFVAAAGANQATAREVDTETVVRADKLVIDSPADSLANAGDLAIPIAEGAIREDEVAGISDIVAGARPGRETDDEITYYKSIGLPIQDLITAQHIERRAIDAGGGTVIELGGDHD